MSPDNGNGCISANNSQLKPLHSRERSPLHHLRSHWTAQRHSARYNRNRFVERKKRDWTIGERDSKWNSNPWFRTTPRKSPLMGPAARKLHRWATAVRTRIHYETRLVSQKIRRIMQGDTLEESRIREHRGDFFQFHTFASFVIKRWDEIFQRSDQCEYGEWKVEVDVRSCPTLGRGRHEKWNTKEASWEAGSEGINAWRWHTPTKGKHWKKQVVAPRRGAWRTRPSLVTVFLGARQHELHEERKLGKEKLLNSGQVVHCQT